MRCQMCNKRPASRHVTTQENGKIQEHHLCDSCFVLTGAFTIIGSMMGLPMKPLRGPKETKHVKNQLRCRGCKMSWSDIEDASRLGCPACYETFKDKVSDLLQVIHKADTHTGKKPGDAALVKAKTRTAFMIEIAKLKFRLDQIVKTEDYEEAAKIRDQIRRLESAIPPA